MMSATASFLSANASLNKKPIYVAFIDGYDKIFSTAPITGTLYPYLGWGGLVGAFTDSSGNVIKPVAIGASQRTFVTPAGATRFQLGVNDQLVGDNLGSWVVRVNGVDFNVPGTTVPWDKYLPGNAAYPFGFFNPVSPALVIGASGLSTGQLVTVQYQSGLVTAEISPTGPACDGDGDLGYITAHNTGGFGFLFPTAYMGVSTIDDWITNVSDLKQTIADLEGGANLDDLVFSVQDRQQTITGDMPSFIFEGARCLLLVGFQGMALSEFVPFFTGAIDTVDSDNGNLEYTFTVSSLNLQKLSKVIYTHSDPDANGNTFAVDSNHPRTINGHPLDILVSALQQAGVNPGLIDTAKIYYYRDTIFNGLSYVFTLTSAPAAKDFIENELMKPLGMYLWENNLAVIKVNSFYPALSGNGTYTPPTPPVAALDMDAAFNVPVEQESYFVDQVTFRFDDSGSGSSSGFNAESVQNWDVAIAKYGLFGSQIIESRGMRSAFQGYFMAAIISRLIFLRYGGKQILLDPLPLVWSQCLLEPGDIVSLTCSFLPDRKAGVLGVTTKTFEILDRTWKFMEGAIEVKLLEIDLSKFKQYLITPNGEANFAADTAPNQAKYMYLSDALGKYSTGVAANTLG